jgi:hypothetical protein
MKRLTRLIGIAILALPMTSMAWDRAGHALIAEMAQRQLTPQARQEVDRLLALEPGATMASVASWADEHRSPQTARWHFVNFPRDGRCEYDAMRDCANGQCVVAAIERQAEILATHVDDESRLKALKYLIHLVGDIHQPLHAGYADDKGGNQYQVHAFGRGSNLHKVWDHDLLAKRPGGAERLLDELVRSSARPTHDAFVPAKWAEESCQTVMRGDLYPHGHQLPTDYGPSRDAVLKDRLSKAGRRLAAVLNSLLQKADP